MNRYTDFYDDYILCATLGLSSYGKSFQNSEVVMVVDEDIDHACYILRVELLVATKHDSIVEQGYCSGVGTTDAIVEGFEEAHNKSALYFTEIHRLPNDLPFITDACTMYMAFFVTREECEYINRYGCERFEEALKENHVDVRKLDRPGLSLPAS